MRNLFVLKIALLTIILTVSNFSQDSSRVILLSKKIGSIIDHEEKMEYKILPIFKENFVSAVFYSTPDSQYYCKVKLKEEKSFKDSVIVLGYASIRNIAFRILYLESIKNGRTNFNTNNVILKFANNEDVENLSKLQGDAVSKFITTPKIKHLPTERLDFDYSKLIRKDINLGISIGILKNSSTLNGLSKIFNILEEIIPQPGFEVPKTNLTFNISPIFKFSNIISIKDKYILELEYGFNLDNSGNQYLNFQTFNTSFGYLVHISKNLNPYVSIAYLASKFKALKKYNIYVDERQGNLESIALEGIAIGVKTSLGIKCNLSSFIAIDVRGSYNLYPNIEVQSDYYHEYDISLSPKVDLKSFELGLSLCFINN